MLVEQSVCSCGLGQLQDLGDAWLPRRGVQQAGDAVRGVGEVCDGGVADGEADDAGVSGVEPAERHGWRRVQSGHDDEAPAAGEPVDGDGGLSCPRGVEVEVVASGRGPVDPLGGVARRVVDDLCRAERGDEVEVVCSGAGDHPGPGGCREGDGDKLGGVEVMRHRIQPVAGDEGVLGEGSLAAGVAEAVGPHLLAPAVGGGARAGGDDLADEVSADDEGGRHGGLIGAGADESVDGVGGDRCDPHQVVGRPWLRQGQLAVADGLGRARSADVGRPHRRRKRRVRPCPQASLGVGHVGSVREAAKWKAVTLMRWAK